MPVLQSRFQAQQHPCDKDVAKLCPHADAPLHCLGTSGAKISPGCTQEIKHAVPFVCSDQIQAFCSDDIEKGVLTCLEEHGPQLGTDCADAIIAAKHALSSLSASKKKSEAAMTGKAKSKTRPPPGAKPCPRGWDGPQAGGCCTKRWEPSCAAACSANQCSGAGVDWEFHWLDFRVHPYTCCPRPPKPASAKYIGGQPHCPIGWAIETKQEGLCCRRAWAWDCGHDCAQARCSQTTGFVWTAVDEGKERYRCCPDDGSSHKPAPSAAGTKSAAQMVPPKVKTAAEPNSAASAMPDGLGSSWVGQPINLASSGWTSGAFALGVLALILVGRRYLGQQQHQSGNRTFKEH